MDDRPIDATLRTTWLAIARMYNEIASHYNSTMPTGFALLNLDRKKGVSSTELAIKLGMEATSLSRVLRSMEEKQLITREKSTLDKRSVLIHLTPFGIEMREVAKEYVRDFNLQVEEAISAEQKKYFYEVIHSIMRIIEKRENYKLMYNH
ncbi:MAG: MarR family transcriptional regulator [Capnocytophaga sp.]|nr:MarR family transcriptional regulator [Capnocytophaga sp.]